MPSVINSVVHIFDSRIGGLYRAVAQSQEADAVFLFRLANTISEPGPNSRTTESATSHLMRLTLREFQLLDQQDAINRLPVHPDPKHLLRFEDLSR